MNADAIIKRLSEQIAQMIVANEILQQQLIETNQKLKQEQDQNQRETTPKE